MGGEVLAVADALNKATFFVRGCEKLTAAVVYKLLLKIIEEHALDIPNARVRNLRRSCGINFGSYMSHV